MFTRPKLPFNVTALERTLSEESVYHHYSKHTKKYFDTTNELIKGTTFEDFENLEDLITNKGLRKGSKLYNNAMQAYNHQLYWENLAPKKETGEPDKELMKRIEDQWKTFAEFKESFQKTGTNAFGSAWCWLVLDDNELEIMVTNNADNPVYSKRGTVLLVVDLWEHSYYIDYQSERSIYLHEIWNIINWNVVNERYKHD